MSDEDDDGQEEGGLEGQALVESCWKAFQAASAGLGRDLPDWGDLEDEYLTPFRTAVETAREVLLASEDEPVPLRDAVDRVVSAFTAAVGLETSAADMHPLEKLPWEAVVRHTLNAMEYDPGDHGKLSDHETGWAEWSRQKKEKLDAAGPQA